jgi:hypothetical protein
VNRRQCPGAKQHGELRGIPSIGLDPISRSPRNQRRRCRRALINERTPDQEGSVLVSEESQFLLSLDSLC